MSDDPVEQNHHTDEDRQALEVVAAIARTLTGVLNAVDVDVLSDAK
jgi:hypothetical protein